MVSFDSYCARPQQHAFMRAVHACVIMAGLSWVVAVSPARADEVSTAEASPQRPNIIFFFADDQRNDTLSCVGHPIVQTPNIDALASRGVRFENAFVTTSICWVSRSTVLTGLWSRTHGTSAVADQINSGATATLFPKLLKKAGYRNGFFGKWHAKMPAGYRRQQDFDAFEDISRSPYLKPQADGTLRHETDLIADRGVEFLNTQSADQPFCLNLWFNAAHAEDGDKRPGIGHFPWPQSVDGMYDDQVMPPPRLNDPAIFESQPDFLKNSINRERYFWRWDTPEKYQINMRAYFRMISGIDHAIGRVLDTLKKQGLADNTIIIYSADNGYYMGDRGFAGKWSHYEQSLRVPMIILDPRLDASRRGRVESAMVLNADIPATILDSAGISVPAVYQGRSIRPLLEKAPDQTVEWREDFFAEHLPEFGTRIPKWEGIRESRFVYARYFENDYEFLHDLQEDPDQLTNFVSDPQYGETLERLRKRCNQVRDEYTATRRQLENTEVSQ